MKLNNWVQCLLIVVLLVPMDLLLLFIINFREHMVIRSVRISDLTFQIRVDPKFEHLAVDRNPPGYFVFQHPPPLVNFTKIVNVEDPMGECIFSNPLNCGKSVISAFLALFPITEMHVCYLLCYKYIISPVLKSICRWF